MKSSVLLKTSQGKKVRRRLPNLILLVLKIALTVAVVLSLLK